MLPKTQIIIIYNLFKMVIFGQKYMSWLSDLELFDQQSHSHDSSYVAGMQG